MEFISIQADNGIAVVQLSRGKVNALNLQVVEELHSTLSALERDGGTRAVVLTGAGKFFSFGFDIPEFLPQTREEFTAYLNAFTGLYRYMFGFPKPLVAAINGHCIAGACMLALACDHRVMTTGKAKISLNEITFGAAVFAGATEMLRFWAGGANATQVLTTGAMYTAAEAKALGMVEDVVEEAVVLPKALEVAGVMAASNPHAFAAIKALLRTPALEIMDAREGVSITEFVEIWYSEFTRGKLREIPIY